MNEGKEATQAIVIQLDEYDRSLGTDEMNLAEWPLASLSTRNDVGQNTLLFEDTIFDKGANKNVERTVVIAGSDHFGLPTSTDSDILLVLVHLTNVRNGLKAKKVEFSRYELIKFLGWPQDGRSYKRLDESLQRWCAVTLNYKHAWWDRSGKRWKSRSFHVLETLELRGRDEIHDDGLSTFTWNDVIFESFNAGNLKRIDLGVYFNLKLATSRQMYRFLDKRFHRCEHRKFDLLTFATEHVGLSRKYDNYDLKRKLMPAIEELEKIGFIVACSQAERFERVATGRWMIHVTKARGDNGGKTSDSPMVAELTSRGVNQRVAKDLASRFSEQHIEEKLQLHDHLVAQKDRRISRNAPGFLAASIRHDYKEPPSNRRASATVSDIRGKTVAPAPAATEKAGTVSQLKNSPERDEFQKHWDGLPIEDRIRLERDAMQRASQFHRDTLKRLESSDHALLQEMRMQIVSEYWRQCSPPVATVPTTAIK